MAGPIPNREQLHRLLRVRWLVALATGVLVFAAVAGLRMAGALQTFEFWSYDRFLRERPRLDPSDVPIVLVQIHEEDIQRFGHPIGDRLLARALELLLRAEPRAIGVDLYRDIPVPQEFHGFELASEDPPDYVALGETVKRAGSVVLVRKHGGTSGVGTQAPRFLEDGSQVAISDLPVDPGGIVRRGVLYLWDGDVPSLSLAVQLAARYLAPEGVGVTADPDDPNRIMIGPTKIPPLDGDDGPYVGADTGGYQFLLDYRLPLDPFDSYSLSEVVAGVVPVDALRDKVVIVGTTSPSVKDDLYTPIKRGLMYGMKVHARAAYQLIRYGRGESKPLAMLGDGWENLWILVWSLLGALVGLWHRSPFLSAFAVTAGLAALVGGGYQLFLRDVWVPVAPAAASGLASAGLVTLYSVVRERSDRREVTSLFSRFLRPQVADQIWSQRDQFMRGDQPWRPRSQWVTLTTMMLDLEGFTAASEKADPYVLMEWINEFTNAMADLVDENGGVVDDYAGDGIKANFGFPSCSEGEQIDVDANNAVHCALAMGDAMRRLNQSWAERDLPRGRVRIGIMTGQAVVGVLGGDQSLKYTTVGDSVNAAARLESFDKDSFLHDVDTGPWRILIGEETRKRLHEDYEIVDLGAHSLKGKQEPVRIFRVIGCKSADTLQKESQS